MCRKLFLQLLRLIYITIFLAGTAHFEELGYLFYPHITKDIDLSPAAPDSQDYRIINYLTQLWTDFAKTGYHKLDISYQYFL